MKKIIDQTFKTNLLTGSTIKVSGGTIEYTLPEPAGFNVAMIREDIKAGQRIEKFHLEAWDGKAWNTFSSGTTVGYKRILRFPMVMAQKIRFVTDSTRAEPAIMDIGLFKGPEFSELTN
jgi:alpha-L-fucosidase